MRINRRNLRGLVGMLAVAGVSSVVGVAWAATLEQLCAKDKYAAAARYEQCETNAFAKWYGGTDADRIAALLSKCRVKYQATWPKLQAKWARFGTTCAGPRFMLAGGAVYDNLTELEWEQKTDDGDPVHDVDNTYTWGGAGTATSDFLRKLNAECFAGDCDWRLPTIAEIQTILAEPYPCATGPCVDPDVFGPTKNGIYWSSTEVRGVVGSSTFALGVQMMNGAAPAAAAKIMALSVRGVRGGL
jgi:hypothetical protein